MRIFSVGEQERAFLNGLFENQLFLSIYTICGILFPKIQRQIYPRQYICTQSD